MAIALGGGTSRMSGTAIAAAIDASSTAEQALASALAGNTTAMTSIGGSALYTPLGTGVVARPIEDWLRQEVHFLDFVSAAERTAIRARTSTADHATAIQAAINEAKARGGAKIVFPAGDIKFGTKLDLMSSTAGEHGGIKLEGVAGARNAGGTHLIWTGAAGSGMAVDLSLSQGIIIDGIGIRYNHAAYDGNLIGCTAGSGVGASSLQILNAWLGGLSNASKLARTILNLDRTYGVRVSGCVFEFADKGIIGHDGNFSNQIEISGNTFIRLTTSSIHNPKEGWTVGPYNAFEPTASGSVAGMTYGSGIYAIGLVVCNNWFGDANVDSGVWLDLQCLGGEVIGNFMGLDGLTTADHIKLTNCSGVNLIGNYMLGGRRGIDLATGFYGNILGNRIGSTTKINTPDNMLSGIIAGNEGIDNRIAGNTVFARGTIDFSPISTAWSATATTGAATGDKFGLYNGGGGARYGFGIQSGRVVIFGDYGGSGVAIRAAAASGAASAGQEAMLLKFNGALSFPLSLAAASAANGELFNDGGALKWKGGSGTVTTLAPA